ncbi:hypothetical protein CR513_60451, partial [Mucuna pruriens]
MVLAEFISAIDLPQPRNPPRTTWALNPRSSRCVGGTPCPRRVTNFRTQLVRNLALSILGFPVFLKHWWRLPFSGRVDLGLSSNIPKTFTVVTKMNRCKIRTILIKDNCLDVTKGGLADITEERWKEMDDYIVANLQLIMVDSVLSNVVEKKTTKDIWDAFIKLCKSLPYSYDQLIIIITNNNIAGCLSFDDVVGAILEEESRNKDCKIQSRQRL